MGSSLQCGYPLLLKTMKLVNVICDFCGEKTTNTKQNSNRNKHNFCDHQCYSKFSEGKHHSPQTEYKPKEGCYKWKGGMCKSNGYIYIRKDNHPFRSVRNYVAEHRLIMEKHLGRYLTPQEEMHHINFKRDDNRLENLILFPNKSEHRRHHEALKKCAI